MAISEPPARESARLSLPARHLTWLKRQPMAIFTLLLAIYSMVARIAPALILVLYESTGRSLPATDWEPSLFAALVWAPLAETFIGQWLPLYVVARLKGSVRAQLIAATVVFSLLHLPDVRVAIFAVPPAFALAYAYVIWCDRGRHRGYWAAALTHFWVNGLATLIGVLLNH